MKKYFQLAISLFLIASNVSAQLDTLPFPNHVTKADVRLSKDALRCLDMLPLSVLGGNLYASPDSGANVLPIPDGPANRKEMVVWTSVQRNYLMLRGKLYSSTGDLRPQYELVVYSDSSKTNTFVVVLKTDCSTSPCNNSFEVYKMVEEEGHWLRVTDSVLPWLDLTEENIIASTQNKVITRKGCTPGLLFEVQPKTLNIAVSMNCSIRDQLKCGELENGDMRCREPYLLLNWKGTTFTLE